MIMFDKKQINKINKPILCSPRDNFIGIPLTARNKWQAPRGFGSLPLVAWRPVALSPVHAAPKYNWGNQINFYYKHLSLLGVRATHWCVLAGQLVIFYSFLEGSDNMAGLNGVMITPHRLAKPDYKLNSQLHTYEPELDCYFGFGTIEDKSCM